MFDFGIGQLPGFLQMGEKLVGYWKKWRQRPEPETLPRRFVRLFEAHGVHRNQIPRFFDHGLQLKDVQTDSALIQCLTDEHLASASKLFGVERQWLERGEGRAHALQHFYVQPKAFADFLDALVAGRQGAPHAEVTATLIGTFDRRNVESTLMVAVPIGELNDEVIYRYHHINVGGLGYWKVRLSAAAMVAQALGRVGWVSGRNCDAKLLEELIHNKDLTSLVDLDKLTAHGRRVEIEDWLLDPEALLDGVDSERDSFGVRSALEMWLKLDAEGWMKHPYANQGAREKFEMALEAQKTV